MVNSKTTAGRKTIFIAINRLASIIRFEFNKKVA